MSRTENKEQKKGKRRARDIAYYIIMLLLLGVMAFSGYKVYTIASEYKKGTDIYENLAEAVGAAPESTPSESTGPDQIHLNTRLNIDWKRLKDTNADIRAWIRSVGTVINYPIVQGRDNDYYLNYTLAGTWNIKGTIFIDANCANPFDDFLTIVYGHRVNDNSMFTSLHEYFDARETPYFEEHPIMELYTPSQNYELHIFGAAVINAMDTFLYNCYLYNEEEQESYIRWIFENNALVGYDNRVSVTADDHIIMLSTCLAGSDNDNRVVVWGKLVEME